MLLKRDEVAILQTGKNMSSLLFLKEHEESGDQLVGQKYSEKSVRTLPRFSIYISDKSGSAIRWLVSTLVTDLPRILTTLKKILGQQQIYVCDKGTE